MTDFRFVTEGFAVSPQIAVADVPLAAAQGFTLIINNRPDGEVPGQPTGVEIAAAAAAAGLDYASIPIVGRPTRGQADAVREAVGAARGKVLAYCRSGTRSIFAWSVGESLSGARSREDVISLAAQVGYDVSGMLPGH